MALLAAQLARPGLPVDAENPRLWAHGSPRERALTTDVGHVRMVAGPPGHTWGDDGHIAAWMLGDPGDPARRPTLHDVRAGAFLEASRDGLVIARGPYGGRSLYYVRDHGAVLVSSSLAGLVGAFGERPALDVDCLAAYALAEVASDPRATVYRGVRRVLPCEIVAFGAHGMRSSFRVPQVPERLSPDAAGHARFLRDRLTEVVSRELSRFSAVAVATGGGLDSSGLLALVARHAAAHGGPRFTGATLDFAGPGDDRPHMEALLQMLGAETIRVTPGEVGPISRRFFMQDAAPFHWPTSPLETLSARRTKSWGADVLLTGVGGDHVLDGDFGSFERRVRRGDLRALVDLARLQVPWRSSARSRVTEHVVKPLVRTWMPASLRARWRRRQHAHVAPWAGQRVRALRDELVNRPVDTVDEWQTAYALSHQLMLIADARGQEEAACGLLRIDPYLDPSFVQCIASLPPEELFFGGRARGLFRLAMLGLLPESLRLRSDKASLEPIIDETFAVASAAPGLRELLTMEATADLGLVEPAPFRAALDCVARGEPGNGGWLDVWPMLAIEGFVRTVESGRGAQPADDDSSLPTSEA